MIFRFTELQLTQVCACPMKMHEDALLREQTDASDAIT